MDSRILRRLVTITAMLAIAAIGRMAAAQSLGLMHLPSTVPQYLGYGYGAGHHAPIVHTPGFQGYRVPRKAWSPGYAAPAWYAPIGCNGGTCGCGAAGPPIEAESMWTGSTEQTLEGPMMAAPESAAPRALVAPPMPATEPAPGPGVNRRLPPPSKLPAPDDRQARRQFFPF